VRKILKLELLVFVIFLTSCGKFNWTPRPYVGVSDFQIVQNEDGDIISCSEPLFDEMTCFDAENIAELKTAIDQVKDKKLRHKLQSKFKYLTPKVQD